MENKISASKDIIAMIKDILALLLLGFILIYPEKFKNYLISAGVTKVSWGGVEWQPQLSKADISLKDANLTIGTLSHRLDSSMNLLSRISESTSNESLKKEIDTLNNKNEKVLSETQIAQTAIKQTIKANAPIVNKVQDDLNEGGKWGVVWSGDATLDGAAYEMLYAKKNSIPNGAIYFRHGSYRSVAVMDSKTQANEILIKAKQRRADAYIVPMEVWCPVSNPKKGFLECVDQ